MGGAQSAPDFRSLLEGEATTPEAWKSLSEHPSKLDLFLRDFSIPFVTSLVHNRRQNFVQLFAHLLLYIETAGYREPGTRGSLYSPRDVRSVVTAVRILSRLIPHVMRDESLEAEIEAFLNRGRSNGASSDEPKSSPRNSTAQAQPQSAAPQAKETNETAFGEHDHKHDNGAPLADQNTQNAAASSLSSQADADAAIDQGPQVHARVVKVLTDLLFLPGFCVSRPTRPFDADHDIHLDVLWATGFGVPSTVAALPSSVDIDQRRCGVIEALLVCSSAPLGSSEVPTPSTKWSAAIVDPARNRFAITLLYALVNTVACYDPFGYLPYSYAMSTDSAESVVDKALQLLLVLLDLPNAPSEEQSQDSDAGVVPINAFRDCLFHRASDADYEFVLTSFVRLLNNPRHADNTYFPGSMKEFESFQELVGVFWKMLDESPGFYAHCMKSDLSRVVIPLLYFMLKHRRDTAHIGLIHVCTFILLKLSPSREFALSLNADFTEKLPIDLPRFQGTIGDLLIIAAAKVMTDSQSLGGEDSLCQVLLTVLANVSPYLTKLCLLSSIKLLHLFGRFSKPGFVVADETHPQFVFFLLEVFNNIIQYQYSGNSRLVYATLMQKHLFYNLALQPAPPKHAEPSQQQAPPPQQAQNADAKAELKSPENALASSIHHNAAAAAAEKENGYPENGAAASEQSNASPAPQQPPQHLKKPAVPHDHPWLVAIRQHPMLATVLRLLDHLVPFLEKFCGDRNLTDAEILSHIKESTVVGVLPAPHSIVVRRFKPCSSTTSWFTRYFWGLVFLRNQEITLFDPDSIELFAVERSEDDLYYDSDDAYDLFPDDDGEDVPAPEPAQRAAAADGQQPRQVQNSGKAAAAAASRPSPRGQQAKGRRSQRQKSRSPNPRQPQQGVTNTQANKPTFPPPRRFRTRAVKRKIVAANARAREEVRETLRSRSDILKEGND